MNVYDFDQTIYHPDSSYHFYFYCLKKHPRAVLPTLPKSLLLALRYRLGLCSAKELKEQLFSFLQALEDVDHVVERFWNEHHVHMQDWYLRQKREDDVIVSASPEFLLKPMAKKHGFHLIGTLMDKRSGRIDGENCHDEEKVRRFRERFPFGRIEHFYSDSLSDTPLAKLAERAFLVDRGRLSPWRKKGKH